MKSNAEYQEDFRSRLKDKGWVRVELVVPKRFKARLKRYEKLIKDKLVKEFKDEK